MYSEYAWPWRLPGEADFPVSPNPRRAGIPRGQTSGSAENHSAASTSAIFDLAVFNQPIVLTINGSTVNRVARCQNEIFCIHSRRPRFAWKLGPSPERLHAENAGPYQPQLTKKVKDLHRRTGFTLLLFASMSASWGCHRQGSAIT